MVTATPSSAADLAPPPVYRKAPVYAPVVAPFSWQGLYFGFNGGYGWGRSTLTNSAGVESTISPDGALLGSTVGYNLQAGNVVYGIEGDIDYSWMRATSDAVAPCPGCEARNHYLATIRGRLGYAVNGWLPYITGGAVFGDIQTSTPTGSGETTDKVGWTVGGGLEYAFPASNWSAKLEYLYADLGTATCDIGHCGTLVIGSAINTSFHASVARIGINYHY